MNKCPWSVCLSITYNILRREGGALCIGQVGIEMTGGVAGHKHVRPPRSPLDTRHLAIHHIRGVYCWYFSPPQLFESWFSSPLDILPNSLNNEGKEILLPPFLFYTLYSSHSLVLLFISSQFDPPPRELYTLLHFIKKIPRFFLLLSIFINRWFFSNLEKVTNKKIFGWWGCSN